MADENGKRRFMTHEEFFHACEAIRNHREVITREVTTFVGLVRFLDKQGCYCSLQGAQKALKMTGVELKQSRHGASSAARGKQNARVIATCLVRLYKKLGEEVPTELIEVVESLGGRPVNVEQTPPTQPPPKAVPATTAVDPKSIRIAR
jgi:hypothetical protein